MYRYACTLLSTDKGTYCMQTRSPLRGKGLHVPSHSQIHPHRYLQTDCRSESPPIKLKPHPSYVQTYIHSYIHRLLLLLTRGEVRQTRRSKPFSKILSHTSLRPSPIQKVKKSRGDQARHICMEHCVRWIPSHVRLIGHDQPGIRPLGP